MAELDTIYIIMLVTFFVIFGVFLFFDLFKRNEKYSFLVYIVVLLPINYLWYLTSVSGSVFDNMNSLTVFLIWIILIDICLMRDLVFVYRKTKDFDDIILFLLIGLFIQLVITAIIPNTITDLQSDTAPIWVFYIPDIHSESVAALRIGFQVAATFMVLLAIIPLILDIKDEEVSLPVIVLIAIFFYVPFLYIGYLWLPGVAMFVVAFLLSVILFIMLLIITRSS